MKTSTETELRELDAWIAEHVFGRTQTWIIIKRGLFYRPNACGYTSNIDEAWRCTYEQAKEHEAIRGDDDDVIIRDVGACRYSTDPAAAMQVLEKCLEKKNSTRGLLELMKWNDSKFSIYSGDDCQSTAETLPLAICKFAKILFSK